MSEQPTYQFTIENCPEYTITLSDPYPRLCIHCGRPEIAHRGARQEPVQVGRGEIPIEMQRNAQANLIATVRKLVGYWAREKDVKDERDRLEGLAHSILCIFDGVQGSCSQATALMAINGPEQLHDLFNAEENTQERAKNDGR